MFKINLLYFIHRTAFLLNGIVGEKFKKVLTSQQN